MGTREIVILALVLFSMGCASMEQHADDGGAELEKVLAGDVDIDYVGKSINGFQLSRGRLEGVQEDPEHFWGYVTGTGNVEYLQRKDGRWVRFTVMDENRQEALAYISLVDDNEDGIIDYAEKGKQVDGVPKLFIDDNADGQMDQES